MQAQGVLAVAAAVARMMLFYYHASPGKEDLVPPSGPSHRKASSKSTPSEGPGQQVAAACARGRPWRRPWPPAGWPCSPCSALQRPRQQRIALRCRSTAWANAPLGSRSGARWPRVWLGTKRFSMGCAFRMASLASSQKGGGRPC